MTINIADDERVMALLDRLVTNADETKTTVALLRRTEAQIAVSACALTCARAYNANGLLIEDAIAKAVVAERARQIRGHRRRVMQPAPRRR